MNGIELKLNFNEQNIPVYLSGGFFNVKNASSAFHRHGYTEVHITYSGSATVYTVKENIQMTDGSVTVIPAGMPHRLGMLVEDTKHLAFLIDYNVGKFMHYSVSREAIEELIAESEKLINGGRDSALPQCIAFICKEFMRADVNFTPIESREFKMREFFENNYNRTVSLSDLAEALGLSEKQTARTVQKYMGDSFEAVLVRYRLNAAQLLMQTDEKLTLTEISRMVGYNSYSGFWKAMKNFKEKE